MAYNPILKECHDIMCTCTNACLGCYALITYWPDRVCFCVGHTSKHRLTQNLMMSQPLAATTYTLFESRIPEHLPPFHCPGLIGGHVGLIATLLRNEGEQGTSA